MRELTVFEREVLARLETHTGMEKHGAGPWERSWVAPHTPAESRAMARLHERGLIECRGGRPSAKLPCSYRVSAELPADLA